MKNAALEDTEEELESSRNRYRMLYDEAPVGYVTLRANGLIREANCTFSRMLGIDTEQLCRVSFMHFIFADDEDIFHRHRSTVLAAQSPKKCVLRLVATDGQRIWVQLESMVCDHPDPGEREWRIVVSDVSERKESQDDLYRQKELLQAIFDRAPALIATVNAEHVVQLVNREWERVLGWSLRELRDPRGWQRIFPHAETRKQVADFLRDATGRWAEFRATTCDRNIVDLRCAAMGLSDGTRIVIAQDVTEERHADQRIQEQQESLRRVAGINTISEMAAAIAHEVNQPLTALVNYASGAANRLRAIPSVPREALEAIEKTVVEAHRASNIIRHIRSLVQRRKIEPTSVDVNELVEKLAHVLSIEASRLGITIRLERELHLPRVPADGIQVEQVVLNLARNALEAMDKTPAKDRELVVRTSSSDGGVLVSVIDNGHGLTPEVREKLFTPFFTTKPFGTGIGLSLCLSVVEGHGGRLWAESNPHGGTIFHFTLPASPAPIQNAQATWDIAVVAADQPLGELKPSSDSNAEPAA